VKDPPEAVIDFAALHALIKYRLGFALEGLPLLEGRMVFGGDRCQHFRAVGEEKSIADIEENDSSLGHGFILQNLASRFDEARKAAKVEEERTPPQVSRWLSLNLFAGVIRSTAAFPAERRACPE
jgi:hypothetical protein